MIVECGTCHAKYNVDDNKIPAAGVKVRCHKCQNIMVIIKPEPVAPVVPSAPEIKPPPVSEPVVRPPEPPVSEPVVKPPEPPPVKTPEPPVVTPPVQTQLPEPPITKPEIPEPVAPTPPPQDSGMVIEKTETPTVAAQMSEDDKKWMERARRLAKALASDLVLYNQDKVEQGLRDGSLAQLLGSEIRRSWEYFCQQIPRHIVEGAGSQLFKEQLNKIVGKGKEIFK
jgi:predicted Zn finger-like uncharacterized protein